MHTEVAKKGTGSEQMNLPEPAIIATRIFNFKISLITFARSSLTHLLQLTTRL
jgi:hypothetical protein